MQDFNTIVQLYIYYSRMADYYFYYYLDTDDEKYFRYHQFEFLKTYYENILRVLYETT